MRELPDETGQQLREQPLGLVEPPLTAVGLADRVREHPHLDRRHTGERCSAQDGVALHRLDLAPRRAADARRGPDRLGTRPGQGAAGGFEQGRVGRVCSSIQRGSSASQ